jgi:hypothetical protein
VTVTVGQLLDMLDTAERDALVLVQADGCGYGELKGFTHMAAGAGHPPALLLHDGSNGAPDVVP